MVTNTKELLCLPAPGREAATASAGGVDPGAAGNVEGFSRSLGIAGDDDEAEEVMWSDAARQNPERLKNMQSLFDDLRARLAAFDRQSLASEKGNTEEIKNIALDTFPVVQWLVESPPDAEAMGCSNIKVAAQARPMIGDKVFEFVWRDIKSKLGRSTKSKIRTVILVAIAIGTTTEQFVAAFDSLERAYTRALPIKEKLTAEGDLPDMELPEATLEALVSGLPPRKRDLVDAAFTVKPLCPVPDEVPIGEEVELLIRLGGHIQGPLGASVKEVLALIGKFGVDLSRV